MNSGFTGAGNISGYAPDQPSSALYNSQNLTADHNTATKGTIYGDSQQKHIVPYRHTEFASSNKNAPAFSGSYCLADYPSDPDSNQQHHKRQMSNSIVNLPIRTSDQPPGGRMQAHVFFKDEEGAEDSNSFTHKYLRDNSRDTAEDNNKF